MNQKLRVKLLGGRECTFIATVLILGMGVLKGYDQLLNMVLDDTVEYLRGLLFCE
jgi:small nuclear ribonucleoprotein (snRNP)-like protein